MADAMVVARMAQEKKDAVAARLAALGTNASAVINLLYDYIEEHGELPEELTTANELPRSQRMVTALEWLNGIPVLEEGNPFQFTTDKDIRRMRLASRGYEV